MIRTDYTYSGSGLIFVEDDLFRDGIGKKRNVGFALDKEASIGPNTIVDRVDTSE